MLSTSYKKPTFRRLIILCTIAGCTFASQLQAGDAVLIKNKVVKSKQTITPQATASNRVQTKRNGNRILVRYKNTQSVATLNATNRSAGTRVVRSYKIISGLRLLEVNTSTNMKKALETLRQDPNVLYAEPDYRIQLRGIPNDMHFNKLWGLHNDGTTGGFVDADINAPEAWDITRGDKNTVVAIIDSGVDYTHVDLRANMWRNPNEIPGNGIDDDKNGYVDDIYGIDTGDFDSDPLDSFGHGTHIAGTIAAEGNNNIGVTGVNWNAQIIACKNFSNNNNQGLRGFVSSSIECLDYIYDLKVNAGINIVATNNSWGWEGPQSQALYEAIQKHVEGGIIFVAAAGNSNSSNDVIPDNPSSYYLPNVISVAATNKYDELSFFSNFGQKSVHVAAPGEDILSSVPGIGDFTSNPFNNIFFDDAENGAGTWVAEVPWAISNVNAFSGTQSWTDSPLGDYSSFTDASLVSPVFDLSAYLGQEVYLGYMSKYQIEDFYDVLLIEFSPDNGLTWNAIDFATGYQFDWKFSGILIPQEYLTNQFQFRFHLISDSIINFDGVYIDDIGIGTVPAGMDIGSNQYEIRSGTSMAAPHVVGLLALLNSQDPNRDWKQNKNLLLAGGTPLNSLANNTVTGRRLRAADADGMGALTCINQSVSSRLLPRQNTVSIIKGSDLNVSVLNINCDQPAGEVSITLLETNQIYILKDDGLGFDQIANDGIYSLELDSSNIKLSNFNLLFPDGDTLNVILETSYDPAKSTVFKWRELGKQANFLNANPDIINFVDVPFAIPFRNDVDGYQQIGIATSGYITLNKNYQTPGSIIQSVGNTFLPATGYSEFFGIDSIVGVFIDDLIAPGRSMVWGVIGNAPNRELVIEWRKVTHFEVGGNVTFQVVFFENSSDVIFNYKDLEFGDLQHNFGGFATVGIQVSPNFAQVHSVLSPVIRNETALIWKTN